MNPPAEILGLDLFDRVLERVSALGVNWQGSRFAIYRGEMMAHASPDRAFVEAYRADKARQRLSFEAASQMLQLVLAETVWDQLDGKRLVAALRTIVKGPALDPGKDDRPRNTLAELVAAAHFAGRFGVSLTADAEDVRLDHVVVGRGAVECKRPTALKNILPNLNEAGRQHRNREKDGSRFGVVLIAADRIADLASQAYEAPTAVVAERAMQDMVAEVASAVLRAARNVACDAVPPAVYATILLTGATLVRKPLHMRPICQVVDFPFPRAIVSREVHEAFKPKPGGPMSKYSVAEHTGPREPPASTG